MSEAIITVSNLGKKYRIAHQGNRPAYTALRDVLASQIARLFQNRKAEKNGSKKSMEDFWALKDVSFEIKPGEVVGIIGRNGAGKSTLLKILSRITEPTDGEIRIRGRVASLLEVGTGFHPELTGRENVFLNGAILGMSRAEIKSKFDEIVAFAEVEKFLDTPVKRYSSGMYVRLAFAVAAHLEPEILIVDEVLAVGDAQFQKKCLGKMQDVAKGGRTVLFVSHNMGVVSTLTQRCIFLQNGSIIAAGESGRIVEMYMARSLEGTEEKAADINSYRRDRDGDGIVRITGIWMIGNDRDPAVSRIIDLGEKLRVEIQLEVSRAMHGANVTVILKNSRGERVIVMVSRDNDFALFLEPGRHLVTLRMGNVPLAPGRYFVDVGVDPAMNAKAYDVILDYPVCSVVNTGQVIHWLDRSWGMLHSNSLEWAALKIHEDESVLETKGTN
jgi:lipopolysaccharide transport system ATP-binding protein